MTAETAGISKLLLDVAGKPLLEHTVDGALASTANDLVLVVVAGSADGAPLESSKKLAEIASGRNVHVTHASHATNGMAWSLHHGLVTAMKLCPDAPGVVVMLGDDPLTTDALEAVLATAKNTPDAPVAVLRTPPVPHPVYIPRALFPPLPLAGDPHPDRGIRNILRSVDTTWLDDEFRTPVDVDHPEDILALEKALNG